MSTKQSMFARFAAIFVLCAVFAAFIASAPQAAQKTYAPMSKIAKISVGQDVTYTGTIAELNDEYFLQLPGQEAYYKLDNIHNYDLLGAKVTVNGVVELKNESEAVIAVRQYQVIGGNQPAGSVVNL